MVVERFEVEGRYVAAKACITKKAKGLSFFERYLTGWVVLCIVAGIVLGRVAPVEAR